MLGDLRAALSHIRYRVLPPSPFLHYLQTESRHSSCYLNHLAQIRGQATGLAVGDKGEQGHQEGAVLHQQSLQGLAMQPKEGKYSD